MRAHVVSVAALFVVLAGCSTPLGVKKQAYAELPNSRTFEEEFPIVWKAIESAFRNHRIEERDPSEVGVLEMKKITERSLRTDWIFGQSRDKYVEYRVNDLPRKKYLQTKLRYRILAKKVIGGVNVQVLTEEEIEKLNEDGSSAGFSGVDSVDSSRAAEVLDRINAQQLSAAP